MTSQPHHPDDERAVTRSWLEAVARPEIARGLEAVYDLVARETAERRPVCVASGRCCNFTKWGHCLYVTGIEAAYTVAKLAKVRGDANHDARREDVRSELQGCIDGHDNTREQVHARPPEPIPPAEGALNLARTISLSQVDAARVRGDCPFLVDKLCSVHTVKPLGCRVYFCDETAQEWQKDLTERALGMIRALHDAHGIEYRYGEWRVMLERVARLQ